MSTDPAAFFNAHKAQLAQAGSVMTQLIVVFSDPGTREAGVIYFLCSFGTDDHEKDLEELIEAGLDFAAYHRDATLRQVIFIGLCPVDITDTDGEIFRQECLVMERALIIPPAAAGSKQQLQETVMLVPVIRSGGIIDFGPTGTPPHKEGLIYPSYFLAGHGIARMNTIPHTSIILRHLHSGQWREEAI